ncbi:hypothetical protein [Comamonas sp. NLF-1-9]|uniref:hypothetical protein n=1 Tax=Comamonas sp. NLF-1-9 TaxID=2853163 RepID=UPI001C49304F|nr:hypothetical protein [Comamonas sp. NLF-1-9]QXL85948.1 hypothetical protein KUD94_10195 [Comamonas sp. NLF-1-9]
MAIDGLGSAAIQGANLQNMDIETLLLSVQSERARLMDEQLINQVNEVKARNNQIAKLNNALSALNSAAAMCSSDGKKSIDSDSNFKKDNYALEREVNTALIDAGITDPKLSKNDDGGGGLTNSGGARLKGGLRGDVKKPALDALITTVKGQIDQLNNSNQMDMLRLQSLTNKRNEAFDVMTNFIKKAQDSRSAIIGNMR